MSNILWTNICMTREDNNSHLLYLKFLSESRAQLTLELSAKYIHIKLDLGATFFLP